jgi:hypothetical protein
LAVLSSRNIDLPIRCNNQSLGIVGAFLLPPRLIATGVNVAFGSTQQTARAVEKRLAMRAITSRDAIAQSQFCRIRAGWSELLHSA